MAFRDSFDQCPRCGITLEDAASARGCRNCGGVFLEEPVLAEMLLRMLPPPPRVWGRLVLAESARGDKTLACPTCSDAMKPKAIHDVELDHCGKHGVWFDQDELRITLYRVADPKMLPPFEEWVAQPYVPPPPPTPQRPIADAAPLPSSNPNVPTLVFHVVQQGRPPREVVTNNEVLKIGKMPRAHLKIDDDPNVSRMHAVIEVKRDAIEVIDLGSMTGTFVNDKQVNKATVVVGDTIRVGGTELVLISVT